MDYISNLYQNYSLKGPYTPKLARNYSKSNSSENYVLLLSPPFRKGQQCNTKYGHLHLHLHLCLQVKRLAEQLDPHSNGRINFEDFCHRVLAINGKRRIELQEFMKQRDVDIRFNYKVKLYRCIMYYTDVCVYLFRLYTYISFSMY